MPLWVAHGLVLGVRIVMGLLWWSRLFYAVAIPYKRRCGHARTGCSRILRRSFSPVVSSCCVSWEIASVVLPFFYSSNCVECLIEEIILSEEGGFRL
ncbi:unnamed protein product [Macrosiphum euphorbiae]|uniref:Secreted protein n=1 Tax=Macrosiphum euphorbiae TaxID=13131 RepID=A0AAV0WB14_9HEMI|nr:unnamed protein product [Macrosiphum euphorbiae]